MVHLDAELVLANLVLIKGEDGVTEENILDYCKLIKRRAEVKNLSVRMPGELGIEIAMKEYTDFFIRKGRIIYSKKNYSYQSPVKLYHFERTAPCDVLEAVREATLLFVEERLKENEDVEDFKLFEKLGYKTNKKDQYFIDGKYNNYFAKIPDLSTNSGAKILQKEMEVRGFDSKKYYIEPGIHIVEYFDSISKVIRGIGVGLSLPLSIKAAALRALKA